MSNNDSRFYARVFSAARGREWELVEHLGGAVPPLDPNKGKPCPKCRGKDRWHRMPDQDRAVGGTRCRQCNRKPDGGDWVSTVRWIQGWSFDKTMDQAAIFLGVLPRANAPVAQPVRATVGSGIIRSVAPHVPPPLAEPGRATVWEGSLGLPWSSLAAFGCEIRSQSGELIWPECDGNGERIGTGRRTTDGRKLTDKGSKRGLILPMDQVELRQRIDRHGCLLFPEGLSDAAALWAMGMPAIGRPQATGKSLARFIVDAFHRLEPAVSKAADLRLIVLGENDRKPNGVWPGREGAEKTGQGLADDLQRPVEIAFPPMPEVGADLAKDVRAWVGVHCLGPTTGEGAWQAGGLEFLSKLSDQRTLLPQSVANKPADDKGLRPTHEVAERKRDESRHRRASLPHIAIGAGTDGAVDPADDARRVADVLRPDDEDFFLLAAVPTRLRKDPELRAESHTNESFRLHLAGRANLFQSVRKGEGMERKYVEPSPILARGILEMGCFPDHVSRIDQVQQFPVVRPDWKFTDRGFDSAARVYCHSDAAEQVPQAPTQEDARAAADRLFELVAEFPWRGKADRSAWLAFLLSFPLRPVIDGSVPFFEFGASINGSGKGLLMNIAWLILTRTEPKLYGLPEDDAETDKRLTACLQDGPAGIFWDDVQHPIGGSSLQRYLTAGHYAGRELKASRILTFPARAIMAATGNNIAYSSSDMRRRVLPIRLLSREDPVCRTQTFRFPNLSGHVKSRYPSHLTDLLTIVRAWSIAGRHDSPSQLKNFPSFEAWSVVRRIVMWIGEPDPLDARAHLELDRHATAEALDNFLLILRNYLKAADATATEILALIDQNRDLAEAFTDCTSRAVDNRLNVNILGSELSKLIEQPGKTWNLRSRKVNGKSRYRPTRIEEALQEVPVRGNLMGHRGTVPHPRSEHGALLESDVGRGCRGISPPPAALTQRSPQATESPVAAGPGE